ncbi:MAG TPA: BTAD domain-containing putative transcriptional regulator [Casimicrobiaceae bacterium]|nr:BTAD domain-containing putative transcriptional regulator [Casimicrobiaceae bacterium]
MPSPRLAKLSPPRASNWLVRSRLNSLLDSATGTGAAWIAAEPGAGKSTLAATWASTRSGHLLWYRVDEADIDPGVAFGCFTALARAARRAGKLPIYRGRDVEKLDAFSRTFFRAFFDLVPAGATLVLDDAHAAAGTDFDTLLAAAVREAPNDVALLIASRRDPDGALLEDVARGALRMVDSAALAFTSDEAAKLLARSVDETMARRLQSGTNGWAAGMLLLAHAGTKATTLDVDARDRVFSYFDRAVLANLDDGELRTLAAASLLPEIDIDTLREMGTDEGAESLLERLRAGHAFVARLERQPRSWRLHDLLRDALGSRFESIGDARWRDELRNVAARIAARRGLVREAVRLHLEAGEQPAAKALAERFARDLVRDQRLAELDAIASALGEAIISDSVALQIALGESAWQRNDARGAVARFERAIALLGDGVPSPAALVVAASALGAILEGWQDFLGSNVWAERLSHHLPARAAIVDPNERLRIDAVCLRSAHMFVDVSPDDRKTLIPRILGALRDSAPDLRADEAIGAAGVLMETAGYQLSDEHLFRDVVYASIPWLRKSSAPPLAIAGWLTTYAPLGRRWPVPGAKLPAATPTGCIELAAKIAVECGGQSMAFTAAYWLTNQAIASNDRDLAWKHLITLREIADPRHPTQTVNLLLAEGPMLALSGEGQRAREVLDRAIELSREHQFPASEQWSPMLVRQRVEIALGDAGRAREVLLHESERYPENSIYREFARILADVAAAACALRAEGAVPAELTRKIVARAREHAWPGFATLLAPIAARVCADALRMGIETDFVKHVIRERNLPAPDAYEPSWPWPIRIHALGGLRVDVDDAPLAFGPRAPRKPLELLKLLVARGPGAVDMAAVFDALWPDAEGAEARGAFDMAVLRLRKLLGRDDALRLDGGRIGFDAGCVWVDAFAFEHGAIDDYAGPLFGDDVIAPWWASARERLHQRFLRRAQDRGVALEQHKDFEQALALYEAALAQDPLAENLYRGAIRCHLAAGRAADALRVYRRCRDQLSIVLGVAPSDATAHLVASISRR